MIPIDFICSGNRVIPIDFICNKKVVQVIENRALGDPRYLGNEVT